MTLPASHALLRINFPGWCARWCKSAAALLICPGTAGSIYPDLGRVTPGGHPLCEPTLSADHHVARLRSGRAKAPCLLCSDVPTLKYDTPLLQSHPPSWTARPLGLPVFCYIYHLTITPSASCADVQDKGVLGPAKQQGFVGPLVYIGNETTARRLGCDPSACSCFFNFQQACAHPSTCLPACWMHSKCPPTPGGVSATPSSQARLLQGSADFAWRFCCHASLKWQHAPLPSSAHAVQDLQSLWTRSRALLARQDRGPCRPVYRTVYEYGPPWCECTLPEPGWLRREHPGPWRSVSRALVIGPPEGGILTCWVWLVLGRVNHVTDTCLGSREPLRKVWCECTLPEPGRLRREHPGPWRSVSAALVIGPPGGGGFEALTCFSPLWGSLWCESSMPQPV